MKSLKEYNNISELPPKLSVFPLPGALLLPRTQLPLNIFEPQYLEMIDDALSDNRLIAMIQTQADNKGQLFKIGCVGKIVSYNELTNNRMLITLSGVCRFSVGQELEVFLYQPFLHQSLLANHLKTRCNQLETVCRE